MAGDDYSRYIKRPNFQEEKDEAEQVGHYQ
jgi:hypothetical protein